jgi:hypothetical protein
VSVVPLFAGTEPPPVTVTLKTRTLAGVAACGLEVMPGTPAIVVVGFGAIVSGGGVPSLKNAAAAGLCTTDVGKPKSGGKSGPALNQSGAPGSPNAFGTGGGTIAGAGDVGSMTNGGKLGPALNATGIAGELAALLGELGDWGAVGKPCGTSGGKVVPALNASGITATLAPLGVGVGPGPFGEQQQAMDHDPHAFAQFAPIHPKSSEPSGTSWIALK